MRSFYRIVHARPQDLNFLEEIELAAAQLLKGHAPDSVLNETTSEEELRAAQTEGRLWVALAKNSPIGFAHVKLLDPTSVHLEEIDVHPDHGRRGLGRMLVIEVCKWAQEHGYKEVTLTTFRDVPWNMPFYAGLGFEEIPPVALNPALKSILNDEARRGLDLARRVAMIWRVPFNSTA